MPFDHRNVDMLCLGGHFFVDYRNQRLATDLGVCFGRVRYNCVCASNIQSWLDMEGDYNQGDCVCSMQERVLELLLHEPAGSRGVQRQRSVRSIVACSLYSVLPSLPSLSDSVPWYAHDKCGVGV